MLRPESMTRWYDTSSTVAVEAAPQNGAEDHDGHEEAHLPVRGRRGGHELNHD